MTNLPENIAKECFLFEAIDYLLVGYPPMEEVFYGDYNARYSYDLYIDGIENFPDSDDEVCNLFYAKYGVKNPENRSIRENLKYTSINHYQSIQELDDYHTKYYGDAMFCNKLSELQKKALEQEVVKNREALKEFLPKKEAFKHKLNEIYQSLAIELMQYLQSGSVRATGLLIAKYDANEDYFLEIDEEWHKKAIFQSFDFYYGETQEKYYDYDENERIERVSIPKEYWLLDNTNFDESSLELRRNLQ